ncbi:phage tail assembly chaperone G [Pseudogracilibacillus auburnensis]|uniref:phage tail assembly chaperone G n=1 Tax=Pseudogracilibacillus auburnensis TaxID=1494959 RepID=UPI001A97271B|nr:hypothetical protein [Pseudogracilibacillus auburnensis]MBO1005605.1 hypothetical protein [Pseudogracilibacillus auburnensis]
MSKLQREMIELVKNPKEVNGGAEPEFEKVWTVPFISFKTSREAVNVINEVLRNKEMSDDDKNDKMADFLAENAFGNKITKDDIFNRLPGPGFNDRGNAQEILEEVLYFVAGGGQSESTKNFLAEKK